MPAPDRPTGLVACCASVALLIAVLAGCASSGGTGVEVSQTGISAAADSPGTTTWPGSSGPLITTIAGTTLSGTRLSIGVPPHTVLVVNAWASWCYPCRSESPALAEVARETAGRGISFVGIDEQDTPSAARQFAATVHSTYPSLIDSDGRILASLRIVPASAIPSTLVILPDGHVAARIIGVASAAQLLALLRPLEIPA